MNKDELAREAFIWDDIVARSKFAVETIRKRWRKEHVVTRMLLSWPSVHLTAQGGETVTHLVSYAIPDNEDSYSAAVKVAVKTHAYALLLIERRGDEIKLILESAHGARSWTLPIRRHGDVDVLEKEKATNNTEHIGVLWRPSMPLN